MKALLTGAAGRSGGAGRGDGLSLLPLDLAVAGAYTADDRAESEPELALAVNGMAPRASSDCSVAMGVILRTSWALT